MKKLAFLAVLLVLSVGCVKTDSTTNVRPDSSVKILRVGVSTNSPPMVYKEHNNINGLEVDLAKGLAKFMGRQLKLVQVDWKDQIPTLLNKRTDIIMSGMTITNARRYQIAFTDPYMVSGQISLIRRVDRGKFPIGMTDLLNPSIKIGTITGTTGDFFIQDVKARGARTQFPTSTKAVKALLAGKIDAFVYDLPGNLYLASKYAAEGLLPVMIPLTREHLAWGVHPENRELLDAANSYIKSLSDQGVLKTTIQRWIPYYRP